METSSDGRYLLLMVKNGDGGEVAHYIRDPQGNWTQVTRFEDEAKEAKLGPDQALYLLSRQGAPLGKILRIPLENLALEAAQVIVPEGVAHDPTFSADPGLCLSNGTGWWTVQTPGGRSSGKACCQCTYRACLRRLGFEAEAGNTVLFLGSSFLHPNHWSRYDPVSAEVRRTALFTKSPADFSDCEVLREFATSPDGTRVPLNILRRKGTRLEVPIRCCCMAMVVTE